MFSIERKAAIINILDGEGSVEVNELAQKFNTSKETIRRDLRELEIKGSLERTYGGAVPVANPTATQEPTEYPISVRGRQQLQQKLEICRKAASYIKDEDTIYVDNSSTTVYLSRFIDPDIHVNILTNSIQFMLEASKNFNQKHTIICLGGILHSKNLSVNGTTTIANAEQYFPNKAFLSCAGISKHNKLADASLQSLEVKRTMIERSQETFILADNTKFNKTSPIFLSEFSAVDYIITDSSAEVASLDFLKDTEIKVVVAPAR